MDESVINLVKSKSKSKSKLEFKNEEETTPNPNFYWGKQNFELENGDTYSGEYCCHKSGIIWREGYGIYSTNDGHVYEGTWENDQLLNSPESKVIFPSGDTYTGPIVNGKYNGYGTYIFDENNLRYNNLTLRATFKDNKPVDDVLLVDYHYLHWEGTPENRFTLLRRTNQFYDELSKYLGIGEDINKEESSSSSSDELDKISSLQMGRSKTGISKSISTIIQQKSITEKQISSTAIQSLLSKTKVDPIIKQEPTWADFEKIYFKKSTKTVNDFTDDIAKYNNIVGKICKEMASTKSSERYIPEQLKFVSQSKAVSVSILKLFLSRSWRKKNKPIPVYTPTNDVDKANEPEDINPEDASNNEKVIKEEVLNESV